ncbi:MAG: S-layer homology domain-containing protein [Synergistaceae bacterium]|jgi:hypothetical protein|nr:S-layer homology domain-containing protein [Synergistaceae bacterium]
MKRIVIFFLVLFVFSGGQAFGERQKGNGNNPFSDLPPGHWAYDAVNTLAAQGLLAGGLPPGSFRGDRPATRHEMAALLTRVLRAFDEERASEEQTLLVRRMAAEFREELRVLGVAAEKAGGKAEALHDRLGGWQIAGNMRLDARTLEKDNEGVRHDSMRISVARLDLVRRFGEDEESFFHMQINDYYGREGLELSKFYARFDVGEWRMTAGRFSMDLETDRMVYYAGRMGYYGQGAWFTDMNNDGIGFSRLFSLGKFDMYVTRDTLASESENAWTVTGRAALRFSERFGADVGINYLDVDRAGNVGIDSVTTLWIAPKVELTRNIGLRGAFYSQSNSYGADLAGEDIDSSPTAWKVVLDIRQDLLKWTSVWLEYDRLERDFILLRGGGSLALSDTGERDFFGSLLLGGELSVWRVGLNQRWNDRWSSWVYFAHYDFSGYPGIFGPTGPSMEEISAGIEYRLNPHTTFALAYFRHNFNEDAFLNKNDTLLFRTALWF